MCNVYVASMRIENESKFNSQSQTLMRKFALLSFCASTYMNGYQKECSEKVHHSGM